MPRFRVRLMKTVEVMTDLDAADDVAAIRFAASRYPGYSAAEVKEVPAPPPVRRSPCGCCDRADEYNGFGSGPTIFTCPKGCGCHD